MSVLQHDETLVEAGFSRGVVRDVARHAIPPGGAYDLRDLLVDRPGVAYKRGGSEFQSSELDEDLIVAVAAPEFPGSPRVVAIGSTGTDRTLYDLTGDTAEAGVDVNGAQPTENPPLYVDRLILTDGIGDGAGTFYPPQKVFLDGDDVDVDDLGGSPPNARCSCVHLSYLVLANTTDNPNRLWFAPTGTNTDIEDTWDTAIAYIDAPAPITGLASVAGVLIVFMRGQAIRILGNIPPGTEGENMETQPLGAVGCIDARSIVKMNGLVYFANESGVYYTNGAGYKPITAKDDSSGIATLWAQQMSGFAPALGAVVCAGVHLNAFLFVTIRFPDVDEVEGARHNWLYHAPTGAWMGLTDGVTADMYATRFAPDGEIYAACGDLADPVRLLRLSPLFAPTADNTADANGDPIEPLLETRPVAAGFGLKAFGHGRVIYDLRDAGTDNPEIDVTVAKGLEAPTFVAAETLPETTEAERVRFDIMGDSTAVTVRLAQTGPSASTEIFGVEVEARPYDQASEVT